jgi:hypothetical protein
VKLSYKACELPDVHGVIGCPRPIVDPPASKYGTYLDNGEIGRPSRRSDSSMAT